MPGCCWLLDGLWAGLSQHQAEHSWLRPPVHVGSSPSESLQGFSRGLCLGVTPLVWTLRRCSSRELSESLGSVGRYTEAANKLSVLNLPCWEFSIFDIRQRLRGRTFAPQEKKAMTKLDSVLKSRDITLSTEVPLVKAMVFPGVIYICENWTWRRLSTQELMLSNSGAGEDSWKSLGQQGDETSPS